MPGEHPQGQAGAQRHAARRGARHRSAGGRARRLDRREPQDGDLPARPGAGDGARARGTAAALQGRRALRSQDLRGGGGVLLDGYRRARVLAHAQGARRLARQPRRCRAFGAEGLPAQQHLRAVAHERQDAGGAVAGLALFQDRTRESILRSSDAPTGARSRLRSCGAQASTMIIQPTPKRSATMPKRLAKKVLPSGICTCPPSASAANIRSAAASLLALRVSEKPSNFGLPLALPSDAMTSAPLMRMHACMILFSLPGGTMPGGGFSGLSLKRIIIPTSAPSAFL